jgi:hypothetical protein
LLRLVAVTNPAGMTWNMLLLIPLGFLANTFLKPKRTAPDASPQATLEDKLRELEVLIERLNLAATNQGLTTVFGTQKWTHLRGNGTEN